MITQILNAELPLPTIKLFKDLKQGDTFLCGKKTYLIVLYQDTLLPLDLDTGEVIVDEMLAAELPVVMLDGTLYYKFSREEEEDKVEEEETGEEEV